MRSVTTWTKGLTAAGLLAAQAFGAFQVQAVEAEPTQAEKEAIAAEKTAPGTVADAVFTTAVVDGQPTDFRSDIENSVHKVFFFTVLDGMMGQTVSHRWKYQGKVMAVAKIDVKSNPDKVWSSNEMKPEWTGVWEVEVIDGSGQVIGGRTFAFFAPL